MANSIKIQPDRVQALFQEILNLKKIRRTGWQLRGIKEGESIADHAFGTAFLAMFLSSFFPQLDRYKVIRMSIAHELGECRVGDIPFPALKYFPNKVEAEKKAISEMMSGLEVAGEEFISLFCEFEEGITSEARFVKAVDKLEMLLTAFEYEKTGWKALGDFWKNQSTFSAFSDFKLLEDIASELLQQRKVSNDTHEN
ncbi:MAG: HD domain-containing protein [Candidatus Riflebacteria bacterium]|nr:HD domain-containing protein [Candidatus Riflebacteria bacterium]